MQIGLLTLHGMGETESDYYADFYHKIKRRLGDSWGQVIFKPIYYQDLLQGKQELLFHKMRDQLDWKDLRKFLLYGFSDAASLEYKKGDIDSPYFKTQERIAQSMKSLFEQAGKQNIPVIILAHSLGCQVLSNYLWDADGREVKEGYWALHQETNTNLDAFCRMRSVKRLVTIGCNIPVFVAGHQNIQAINKPCDDFQWVNFFDKDDVLGWPLQPLSDSYQQLVQDRHINASSGLLDPIRAWTPLSHGQYWKDNDVIDYLEKEIKSILSA